MVDNSWNALLNSLTNLNLVPAQTVRDCVKQLGADAGQPSRLLELLRRRNLLTPYQMERLERGQTDELICGGYKLLYRNASGTFARVFRACSVRDGQTVALKLLRRRWVDDPKTIEQFRREAEQGLRLRHRNIVRVYAIGADGDRPYYTMEFVEGGSLRDWARIRGQLAAAEATRCVLDIARALAYAAARGIRHGDLKATNVLMSADGVAKLIDFSLAHSPDSRSGPTGTAVRQTIEYATLEQATRAPQNDPRTDLFFLGAIYYELLAGTPPFPPTKDYDERASFSRYSHVTPIRQRVPDVPQDVADRVERLMHLSPNARYRSADEAAADLAAVLSKLPDSERQESQPAAGSDRPVVLLIVETRTQQQDVLRSFFSKQGCRVLIVSDLQRAVDRVQTNPPDCVLLMGACLGDEVGTACQSLLNATMPARVGLTVVLASKQAALEKALRPSDTLRVATQPVTLKRLHELVCECVDR